MQGALGYCALGTKALGTVPCRIPQRCKKCAGMTSMCDKLNGSSFVVVWNCKMWRFVCTAKVQLLLVVYTL